MIMANISIIDLQVAGSGLFSDSESFINSMQDLSENELKKTVGGGGSKKCYGSGGSKKGSKKGSGGSGGCGYYYCH
jgi:hypothetical protein